MLSKTAYFPSCLQALFLLFHRSVIDEDLIEQKEKEIDESEKKKHCCYNSPVFWIERTDKSRIEFRIMSKTVQSSRTIRKLPEKKAHRTAELFGKTQKRKKECYRFAYRVFPPLVLSIVVVQLDLCFFLCFSLFLSICLVLSRLVLASPFSRSNRGVTKQHSNRNAGKRKEH